MHDRVHIRSEEVLAEGWATLKRYSLDYQRTTGTWESQKREVFEPGDGAVVLPFDPARSTVLLVRQFRLPAFLDGHPGPLIEACAGKLDGDDPETCIRKEAEEELGYRLPSLELLFSVFMSPGSVRERLWCFAACYSPGDRLSEGGGAAGEGEDIEIMEMPFHDALAAVSDGRIVDAKTILLLQHLKLELAAGET